MNYGQEVNADLLSSFLDEYFLGTLTELGDQMPVRELESLGCFKTVLVSIPFVYEGAPTPT